jgi:hypothetical protein
MAITGVAHFAAPKDTQRISIITRGSGDFSAVVTDADGAEHDVTVKYQGYSDSGRMHPVDLAYAPESEIEIDVEGIPDGVQVDESEHARLEELAFERLVDDNQRRR